MAKIMTVDDLITKLLNLPEEAKKFKVTLEGCDCTGEWSGRVEIDRDSKSVEIKRQES